MLWLNPWLWLAGIVLLAGSYGLGRWQGASSVEARIAAEAAKHAETVTEATDKVVTVYVDKIQRVEVPVPVVRTRLVDRVCPGHGPGVPGAGSADAAAAPDSGTRLIADFRACRANAAQLEALQAAVIANNAK